MALKEYDEAQAYLYASLQMAQALHDLLNETLIYNSLGVIHFEQHHFLQANHYYQKAFYITQQTGNPYVEGMILNNLGNTFFILGNVTQAIDYYTHCVLKAQEHNFPVTQASALSNLGAIYRQLGELDRAVENSYEALRIGQNIGYVLLEGVSLNSLGHSYIELGNLEEAENCYHQAFDRLTSGNMIHPLIETSAGLAYVQMLRGNIAQARKSLAKVLEHLAKQGGVGLEEPLLVYLRCFYILKANHDERGSQLLQQGHQLLQEQLAQMENDKIRQMFLERMSLHREILHLASETFPNRQLS